MAYQPAIRAAGHDGALTNTRGNLFIKPTNPQETAFYQRLAEIERSFDEQFDDESYESNEEPLFMFTCRFYGLLSEQSDEETNKLIQQAGSADPTGVVPAPAAIAEAISAKQSASDKVFIVLDNALYGFTQPNIIDIKLGKVLYDENADSEKQKRLEEVSNTTTSGQLGYRIAGMSLYHPDTHARTQYDKMFGRGLTKENVVQDGLGRYIFGLDRDIPETEESSQREKRLAVVGGILDMLRSLARTLEDEEVRMISASILIVYEGDPIAFDEKVERDESEDEDKDQDEDEDEDEESEPERELIKVKLIDFAHSKFTPNEGPDKNVLFGLHNLIQGLETLENME